MRFPSLRFRSVWFLSISAALIALVLSACTSDNPDEIRRRTAEATATARRDAKAVAEGVKEGMHREEGKTLDVNHASKDQLLNLPGITESQADRIVSDRPYRDTHELVTRHILSSDEYGRLKDRIVANQ